MLYSKQPKEVTKQLLRILPPNASFDYPFFCGDLLVANKRKERVNILPYDSETAPFTDRICDMNLAAENHLEKITLNFQDHAPFQFILNRLEIEQLDKRKYSVNDEQSGQQINILFLDNEQ